MRKSLLAACAAILACAAAQAATVACTTATLQDYLDLGATGCAIDNTVYSSFSYDVFTGAPGFNTPSAMDISVVPVSMPGQVGFLFSSYMWYVGQGDSTSAQLGYSAGTTGGTFTGTRLEWGDWALTGTNSRLRLGVDVPGAAAFEIENSNSMFMLGDELFFGSALSSLAVADLIRLDADGSSLFDMASFGWFQQTFSIEASVPGGGAVPEPASALLIGSGLVGLGLFARRKRAARRVLPILALAVLAVAAAGSAQAASQVMVNGEIETIILTDPADVWSGGKIVVGGQVVIIPRNLLMDLPANRLTLQQLFAQAPAACVTNGESGLAKSDRCNLSGAGGFATISANRTNSGNVIAGDVFIQKGVEFVGGVVNYVNHAEGWFRVNGAPGDATTGVMVRLNDPGSRHTVQSGLGCVAGSPNCSPDPRFTLDPDNYTNTFSTGYPLCIPSSVARSFVDVLDIDGDGNRTETLTAQAAANGSGDLLCPVSNRPAAGFPVADSRRFAPLMVGDSVNAEGNFETIDGVRFLSSHTTSVHRALITRRDPGQPDYLFLEEVEIDAPGFQNERARTLFIGFTTLAPSDVVIWSLHRDPVNNAAHEFPLATVLGCDNANGAGTCGQQGLVGAGNNIWKIRHDVDFILAQTGPAAGPKLSPCTHLRFDPRFINSGICPGGTAAEEFAILSPIPHEIMARTGKKIAEGAALVTLDINGAEATNGEYLFPLGMNLGGVSVPEMVEINLDALDTPFFFSGIPWNLDRRLSPGGCDGACESTPQPLNPFPFESADPRLQARLPSTSYSDPNYTASTLTDVRNRIFSFVNAAGQFDGNRTVLAWPPLDPAALPIEPTPAMVFACLAPPPAADTTPPPAAASVTATLSATGVTVNWTASTEAGAVYGVYRDGVLLTATPVTGTTFSDPNTTPGTYVYSVDAVDAAGNRSAQTSAPAVTIAAPLAAPASVTATVTATGVNVNWAAVTGATGYGVYRNGVLLTATPVTATTFSDPNTTPGTYTYSVDAVNAAGTRSAQTSAPAVTIASPLAAPASVTATVTATGVNVSWTAVTGATGYGVYRNGTLLTATPVTGTTFSDPNTTPGTYTYSVDAVNAAGTRSAQTSAPAVTIAAPLAAPASVTATVTATGVNVSWTAVTGATGYGVYRNGVLLTPTAVTATTFSDPNTTPGTYTYSVDAVNAAGTRSAQTSAPAVTIAAPLAAPASVTATVTATGVNVGWTAVTGATGYGVYRNGVLLTPTPVTATNFSDPNTTPGTYTYSVDAVNAAGTRSAQTSAPAVTIAAPLAAPASVAATVTATGVNVGWTAVTGATGYGVYRNGVLLTPTPVTATTFSDPNTTPGTYTYSVDAVNAAGTRSAQTSAPAITIAAPLAAPASVTATVTATGVNVGWTAVTGASGYGVYRNGVLLTPTPVAATTFSDPNTTPGTYTYSVDAVNAAGTRSAQTSAPAVTIAAPVVNGPSVNAPQANFLVRQRFNGDAIVGVSWTLPAGVTAARYELQRTVDGGATWIAVPTTGTATTATVALGSGAHQLRVRAFDAAGNAGPWALGVPFTLSTVDGDAANVSLVMAPAGAWATQAIANAVGGSVQHTIVEGATATYTFTVPSGAKIAFVAMAGLERGTATVAIDGGAAQNISLASTITAPQVLFRSNPLAAGTHTLRVRVSSGRVDVDGFVLMQ